jgi:hypothetical protein
MEEDKRIHFSTIQDPGSWDFHEQEAWFRCKKCGEVHELKLIGDTELPCPLEDTASSPPSKP